MSLVTVSLTAAVICFAGQCHNALVGKDTPTGTFQLAQRYTSQAGYGGDVLQYKETATAVFAVHRVYTLAPRQRRPQRLASPVVADRQGVTGGCINVAPAVYDALVSSDATHILITN